MTARYALQKIGAFPRLQAKASLAPMRALCARLRDPQNALRFVHIAGTNGKGSTATMTASVLEAAGLRVGLYTSPYINTFFERFRINDRPVSEAVFAEAAKRCLHAIKNLPEAPLLSQFDVVTAIGFLIFAEAGCDIVVLECGLGGRFDATNVIAPPLVAAICNIGFDHTEILGKTVRAIALEKCGILKQGTEACVVAPQDYEEAADVIGSYAAEQEIYCRRVAPEDILLDSCNLGSLLFSYKGKQYRSLMAAAYQARNGATAIEIIRALQASGTVIPESAISEGLARAHIPARLETVGMFPHILLDGAHNTDGIRHLRESMEKIESHFSRLFCVVGMLREKNAEEALACFFSSPTLKAKLSGIVTVTPDSPRACPAEELADLLRRLNSDKDIPIVPATDLKEGLYLLLRYIHDADALLCFGSLYMMGDLRRHIDDYYRGKGKI